MLLVALSGCFSVNSGLIAERDADKPPADPDPSEEAHEDAGRDEGEREAGSDPEASDAGSAVVDAAGPAADAQVGDANTAEAEPERDASVPDAQVAGCSADAMCTSEQYCSRVTQRCAPRCAPDRGCALSGFDQPVQDLATFDGQLVILTAYTRNSLMESRHDQAIYLWDRVGAPIKLAGGVCDRLVHITASHIYCRDGWEDVLVRIPRANPASRQVLAPDLQAAWVTASHLWWVVENRPPVSSSDKSSFELWRIGLGDADAAEQVEGPSSRGWVAGTEQTLCFVEQTGEHESRTYAYDLGQGSQTQLANWDVLEPQFIVGTLDAVADDQALYTGGGAPGMLMIKRHPFDGAAACTIGYRPNCNGRLQLSGDHMYWWCNQWDATTRPSTYKFHVERNGLTGTTEPQALATFPSEANARGAIAVLPRSSVYYFSEEARLFEVAL